MDIVVEFGREFSGEVGFIEAPPWRKDLRWVAEQAEMRVGEERRRTRSVVQYGTGDSKRDPVTVRCVLLTRGGEQA